MIENQTDMLPNEIHGALSDFETEMWRKHRDRYRTNAANAALCIGAILGLSLIPAMGSSVGACSGEIDRFHTRSMMESEFCNMQNGGCWEQFRRDYIALRNELGPEKGWRMWL